MNIPSEARMTEEQKSECERAYYIPLRRILIDLSLIAFILSSLVLMRSVLLLTDEVRLCRTGLITQIAETKTMIKMQGREIAANLNRIGVSSNVLIDRIDSQLTKARVQIHEAAATTQSNSVADRQQTKEVLTDTLKPAAQAITTMANQVQEASEDSSNKPLVVQTPQVIVQPSSSAPIKTTEKIVVHDVVPTTTKPEAEAKRGPWRRFLGKLNPFRRRS